MPIRVFINKNQRDGNGNYAAAKVPELACGGEGGLMVPKLILQSPSICSVIAIPESLLIETSPGVWVFPHGGAECILTGDKNDSG
jgi:hypothetical protein